MSQQQTSTESTTLVEKVTKFIVSPVSLAVISVAGVAGAYLLYKKFSPKKKTSSITGDDYSDTSSDSDSDSDSDEEEVEIKDFTLDELHTFDGVTNPKVYVSVLGSVFDVTGSGFYGPGETYSLYAGHDASFALATNDVTATNLDKLDLSELKANELDHLQSMVEHFRMKYLHVGNLLEMQ